MHYTLICDGAYSSSRDQGGLAFVYLKDGELILEYSLMVPKTTNNRMELGAIIVGLTARKKNQDLWGLFDLMYSRVEKLCSNIQFVHTKGHQKDDSEFTKWNNYVDKLAVAASQKL